ncbi:MAG: AMP-binding protein [Paludibacteraceae bacterium]|nr:AMP-binding protein [Paludibacteraceae bacterium]
MSSSIYNQLTFKRQPEIQFKSKSEISEFQDARLREQIAYVAENSPYYSAMFKRLGVSPSDIKTVKDLERLPVTTKNDLLEHNDDFLCVPRSMVTDIVTTSGTTGVPVIVYLTKHDLDRLSYNEFLTFSAAGLTTEDTVQLMTTIDKRFMAGLAYFLGAVELGAGIVRVGGGVPQLQWDTIERIKPTTCMVVPSFLLKLVEYAQANGINFHNSSLKKAVCIGESMRNPDFSLTALSKKINELWPELHLYGTYASTEMQTGFSECVYGLGGHHQPELIVVEFLDENNQPVADNEPGEVTITHLGVEGTPLIRFKTGDICYHHTEQCKCGRNTMRLSAVLGRRSQMIKYKGTTIYPPALFDVVDTVPQVANYVVKVTTNSLGTDDVTLLVGTNNPSAELEKIIKDKYRAKVRVAPSVVFKTPAEVDKIRFPEMSRKPVKFIDER